MRLPWTKPKAERSTIDEHLFNFNANQYTYGLDSLTTTLGQPAQEVPQNYGGLSGAFRSSAIVYACMQARSSLFSEARFQFRTRTGGRPGPYWGSPVLALLEAPWPGASTGDLLARAIQDVDLSGNAYFARSGESLYRLQPDKVTIVIAGGMSSSAEIVGYQYKPAHDSDIESFLPEDVLHWAPYPDPAFRFRGISPLLPVALDIVGDRALLDFKISYMEQGCSPAMVIDSGQHANAESFRQWVASFKAAGHEGTENAGKTLFLANGASATVTGANLNDLDLTHVQGAFELRVAAALGVPPLIVGVSSETAATYSNYGQSRRRFSDLTISPLWRSFCAAAETVLDMPKGGHLAVDVRDVPFNQEDVLDAATIRSTNATAIRTLTDAGFEPDSVVDAIEADDLSLLNHLGLPSVQIQPEPSKALPPMKELPSVPISSNGGN